MIDFSQVSSIEIPEGKVTKIQDSLGNTIWEEKSGADAYLMFSSPNSFQMASYNGISGTTVAKYWNGTIEYSTNGTTWNTWNGSLITAGGNATSGYTLYFRGTGNMRINISDSQWARWFINGSNVQCTGNIETLLDYQTVARGGHPSTAAGGFWYYRMFYNCTSLTTVPELPATTLADHCYYKMFEDCSALITVPALPATTLADHCYDEMFRGCTSLTTVPALPATTLAKYCYRSMFYGCTSLTTVPELPATTLADHCYYKMFEDCSALITVPALPATTLADHCYYNMFNGCASLTTVPQLPATTLARYCYGDMFNGCTSLKFSTTKTGDYQNEYRIPSSGTGTTATSWNLYMFTGTGGTFTGNPSINTTYYTPNRIIVPYCLMFSSSTSFTITSKDIDSGEVVKSWKNKIEYSTDGTVWTEWDGSTITSVGNTTYGYTIYFRGTGNATITAPHYPVYPHWQITGSNVRCDGNIETLLDWATVASGNHPEMGEACFSSMFRNCAALISPPELRAVNLNDSCYYSMFSGCTSLTFAPELPVTELWHYDAESMTGGWEATRCYAHMFQGCTSLTKAPELPATILADGCYFAMFSGCTSLTTIPRLPALRFPESCYSYMFEDCSLIKISSTKSGIYQNEYRIPSSGNEEAWERWWNSGMFARTGGTFTNDPNYETTYYTANEVV